MTYVSSVTRINSKYAENIKENSSNDASINEELDELQIDCNNVKQDINDLDIEVKEFENDNLKQNHFNDTDIDEYFSEYLYALQQQQLEYIDKDQQLNKLQTENAKLKRMLKLLLLNCNCNYHVKEARNLF